MLLVLTHFSKTHTWLLPVFAVGLGAPRWCQMLWGTSSLALYIPWAGKGGPYLGISLWLWLGVLDAIQGVGLGMILLQVSTGPLKFHTSPDPSSRPSRVFTFAQLSPSPKLSVPSVLWLHGPPLQIVLGQALFSQTLPSGTSLRA